jgi:hypothetical protein
MFEITGEEIKKLGDSDLRILVGLLCEAELSTMGIATSGVTWGGHQDAPDGGVDVRVSVEQFNQSGGYLPRKETIFQVKKSNLTQSKITTEMKPSGVLRDSIRMVGEQEGAYIIVSSGSSVTDKGLSERRQAMLDSVSDLTLRSKLHMDFYDCGRVASWVREHKSLVLWVKDRLGSSIQGWQPYGNWSHKPKHANDEYLHDLAAQIYRGTSNFENDKGLTAIEGINEIRAILARTGSSVRLIGLSGVGKTRLLEALFDRRIGEGALNPSDVFYTDIAHSPNPEPITFAEHIRTIKKNCSSRR